jgi:hypothetical protein
LRSRIRIIVILVWNVHFILHVSQVDLPPCYVDVTPGSPAPSYKSDMARPDSPSPSYKSVDLKEPVKGTLLFDSFAVSSPPPPHPINTKNVKIIHSRVKFVVPTEPPPSFAQCCGSGSGIRYLFDPWIRDPE